MYGCFLKCVHKMYSNKSYKPEGYWRNCKTPEEGKLNLSDELYLDSRLEVVGRASLKISEINVHVSGHLKSLVRAF